MNNRNPNNNARRSNNQQRTGQNQNNPNNQYSRYNQHNQNNQHYRSGQPSNGYRQNPAGYDPYPPVRHRSRRKARQTALLVVLTVIIMVMLLVSVVIFAARCASGQLTDNETDAVSGLGTSGQVTTVETTSDTQPPETTAPETTALAANFEYQTMTEADVHKGYLILVNYQNAFTFDTDFVIQPFYGNRNNSYKLRDTLVSLDAYAMDWCNQMMAAFEAETGYHDILVNSAYRTLEEQEEIYSSRVEDYGEEYAKNYVAVPGYSEHHTGLAIDFTIYTDDNESKTFDDMTDYPLWLSENGHRFGYIQRYPSDKVDITKINYENWHYRYVGKPHAYYMKLKNFCLEEYIDDLRSYPYDGHHLMLTDDEGAMWEIYFVAAAGETTEVPVPTDREYTVSGNNVDGFIVTIENGQAS